MNVLRPFQRRGIALLAALAAVLSLAACSSASPSGSPEGNQQLDNFTGIAVVQSAAAKLPARIKQAGKLTVVMNVSSAPTKFYADDNKTIIGLNPDLARALGRILGVEVTIADVQFDGIVPGLQANRYDLATSSMAPTAERIKVLDMIRYATWGTSLAVPGGNPGHLTLDSLCGHKVAVQQGSIQESLRLPQLSDKCVTAGKPKIEPVVLSDQTTALLQLSSARVDAVLADTPVLAWAAKQRPGTVDLVAEMNRSEVAVALPKDSDLTPAIQDALNALVTQPVYKQIFAKWGMDGSTVDSAVLENGGN
jgi:polar amino acid transport system substrate-binding protein